MKRRILSLSMILLAVLIFTGISVSAAPANIGPYSPDAQSLAPGNYCVSCHLAEDPRLITVTEWKGSIGREINSPCPAATSIHEELYYTERLLLLIDRTNSGEISEKTRARLEGYTQRYSRMLDAPITSLDAFISEAQSTRYQLNKIHRTLSDADEAARKQTVLIYAGSITFFVLGSLAWGLYNTRVVKSGSVKPKSIFKPVAFVLLVLVLFTLPLFRVPPSVVETTTIEEQEAQAVLDTADRSATATDRAQARAWLLARLGTTWNKSNPTQAKAVLEESLASLALVYENNTALWGQSISVQEAMIGVPIDMEKADLIAGDLNAARARLWSLPLIAIEWKTVDAARAEDLLEAEQARIKPGAGIYRDLQMRSLALAWAEIQPSRAVPVAGLIMDASLRAWTLRELDACEPAAESARKVVDPVQRARSLREVGVASGDRRLFEEALAALNGVTGNALAYALSDLAAASGDAAIAGMINESFPDARAYAFLRVGEYQAAWDASGGISDPYEQARSRAAIAAVWENAKAADQIGVPLFRDLALRDVIHKSGNVSLVESIQSPYYRMQSLTMLGDYAAALEFADRLANSYPLVELTEAMADQDPPAGLTLVEMMGSEADKAVVLRLIAAVTKDQSLFEQAQGMALAARVQGDSLAPSMALLNLADTFWNINLANAQAALQQAYEAALRIAVK